MWDARFSADTYAYGTQPNDFLVAASRRIPPGPVLCLGSGEGRNAVYLASIGHDVTAVDSSMAGLAKTRRLAEERGVQVQTCHADLADLQIAAGAWSAITMIFVHLPPPVRRRVHAATAAGLRTDGLLIVEAYTRDQLMLGTGGPKDPELLYGLAELRAELPGLTIDYGRERERMLEEGDFHNGSSSVVQVLARRGA